MPPISLEPELPLGGTHIFGHHRFLVAYYGTAQTGSMGVLGQTDPDDHAPPPGAGGSTVPRAR